MSILGFWKGLCRCKGNEIHRCRVCTRAGKQVAGFFIGDYPPFHREKETVRKFRENRFGCGKFGRLRENACDAIYLFMGTSLGAEK